MQTAPVVIQQTPYVVAQQPRIVAITATRGLGITQIIIGALCILFGVLAVALLRYWAGSVGFGIWGGVWVRVTFILAVDLRTVVVTYEFLGGRHLANWTPSCSRSINAEAN